MLDDDLYLMLRIMLDDKTLPKGYEEMEEYVVHRISDDLCRAFSSDTLSESRYVSACMSSSWS